MSEFNLPIDYTKLTISEKQKVRNMYCDQQNYLCIFCDKLLLLDPPKEVTDKKINWSNFPNGFLNYPIHLQHNHNTGMTEGAVHAYCNAVLWQYHGK